MAYAICRYESKVKVRFCDDFAHDRDFLHMSAAITHNGNRTDGDVRYSGCGRWGLFRRLLVAVKL
jgi:hypothetical protein